MCGIVGYIGEKQAQPILLNALKHLEYRGYDSSGISVQGRRIQTSKDKVRVEVLQKITPLLAGNAGIGHTRWATHGEPSLKNAHPHCDCNGRIAVVHNGIITNYRALKDQLIREGHHFLSETDTEVIPHLIEKYYQGDIRTATTTALEKVQGSYAILVLSADDGRMVAAKNGNPLIIGAGDHEYVIASDIPALLEYTDQVIYLEDGDIADMSAQEIQISNCGKNVSRPACKVPWSIGDLSKGGYDHFMIKEIHEQPRVIRDTIADFHKSTNTLWSPGPGLENVDNGILILACGSSYHAGLIAKYIFEDVLDISADVELASELNYCSRNVHNANVIAITQSGETADVLTAMKMLRASGCYLSAITNVRGCSASRIAHETIYTSAGPETSVAATKSFIAQLIVIYQLALSHPRINSGKQQKMALELKLLPNRVQRILENEQNIIRCANFISQYKNAFFIGRGINYPVALEGALKLKEISYIHAEGYAAGELKHGPFSLLQNDTPVVAIVAQDNTYDSMVTNIKEVKSRKSPVIAVISEDDDTTEQLVDFTITVPHTPDIFTPIVNTVALQLLSYYAAKSRECSIDFPRNLAKSVTVE
jgi:glutamine---fructose-6-phosphate transaminase (isomerizing)